MADLVLSTESIEVSDPDQIIYLAEESHITFNELGNTQDLVTSTSFAVLENTTEFSVINQEILVPLDSQVGIEDAAYDSNMYVRKNGAWLVLDRVSFPTELDSYLYGEVETLNSFKDKALGNTIYNKERFISVNDLLDMGIIERIGTGFGYLEPGVDIVYTGPANAAVPPAPKNISSTENVTYIQLFWDAASSEYLNHGHTEVYRSTINDVITGVNIGNVYNSFMTTDYLVLKDTTYYYWFRFVSDTGVRGPWHDTDGFAANLENNPEKLLDVLDGNIGRDQLTHDLLTPIDLITGPGGLVENQGDLEQALINESLERLAAIETEANARANALLAEAEARGTAIDTAVTVLESADLNLANQINILSSVSNNSFDTTKIWQFDTDSNAEGWTCNSGTPDVTVGWMTPSFSGNTFAESPTFAIDGFKFTEIRARIRKIGNPVWVGSVFYKTDLEPSYHLSRSAFIDEPPFFSGIGTATWEMREIGDWELSIVTQLKIQLSAVSDASNYFKIDWIGIGRGAPGASTAVIAEEREAWTSAIAAEASIRTTLAAQMRGNYDGTNINSVSQGLIFEERIARAEAINAIANLVVRVQSGIRTGDSNGELADAVTGWKALAAFTEEVNTRVTNELAASNRSTLIESRLDDDEAAITVIQNTLVTNEEAIAQQIETINASIASNTAAISEEIVARTTVDTATANTVNTLNSVVINNNNTLSAAISNEASTRSSVDNALSSTLSTVQSTVNGHTSSIAITSSALSSLSGTMNSTYSIKLGIDSNGKYYSAGMGISLGNTPAGMQSEVIFVTDNFYLMNAAGGTITTPFRVTGGITYLKAAMIEDATINFAKISDTLESTGYVPNTSGWRISKSGWAEFFNVKVRGDIEATTLKSNTAMVNTLNVNGSAITIAYYAYTAPGSTLSGGGSSSNQAPISVTMPTGSSGAMFIATLAIGSVGISSNGEATIGIYKNGSLLGANSYSVSNADTSCQVVTAFDPSPAGTNVYSITVTASVGTILYHNAALMCIGAKR